MEAIRYIPGGPVRSGLRSGGSEATQRMAIMRCIIPNFTGMM
jgi:hypothetical protein